MSRATTPDKRSNLVAGFVLNTLDEVEAKEFERLAAAEPALLAEVEQLQQSLELSFGLEEVAPPDLLRDRLLTQFSSQANELASTHLAPLSTTGRRQNAVFKAAIAALAVALTLSNVIWWQSSRQQIAQQQPTQPYELEVTEAGQRGTVAVTIDPATLTATLTAMDLPPIAADQTYVLWTVLVPNAPFTTDSKSAVLTTTFKVDEQGDSQKTLALPNAFEQPDSVAALAVTVESTESPQAHEGRPVLLARF